MKLSLKWTHLNSYCKVIVKEESIDDNNVINDNTKPKIYIELPTYKPPKKEVNTESTNEEVKTVLDENVTKATLSKCDKANDLDGELDNISDECQPEVNDPALILTPYIEDGKIEEAREASKVDPKLFLGVESYSGFFTVNKTYDSNMFFWYFPVENKPVNETPWIIWLQGGPGITSLTGLFDEIGPFKVTHFQELRRNRYSWIKNHSLLFIDNPVGTGYSFTNDFNGFSRDMAAYSKNLYSTVKQFLEVFSELKTAPLYIAGESYAGKYVPALGVQLHRHKKLSEIDVNLQGFMIGNALVDPAMIKNVNQPFLNFGLVSKEQVESIEPLIKSFQADIAAHRSVEAKEKWMQLVSILLLLSHQKHGYNFLKDDLGVGSFIGFINSPEVRKAMHVGSIKFSFVNVTANVEMGPDFLSSSQELFEELLDSYRVLSYCGQLDQLLSCMFSAENHRTWQWKDREEFIQATRRPYMFRNRLAGYIKSGGNLTEVVIRGAGHMVPMDEPLSLQRLVTNWIQDIPVPIHSSLKEDLMLQQIVNNYTLLYF
ncbi:venom serine carboxypeptidase-like isoform X2 [Colias croceus]|uniref:venom serine carboxypeptidase-like isoform X2 n=1 Tax=Colias crocea TaxID=72248 RepID=UPI001E27C858|nr:venom serine carboxypeptidase-like isoform X2 [Colias croceus]